MMFAITVPDAYAAPILAGLVLGLGSWLAYMVRGLQAISRAQVDTARSLAEVATKVSSHEHRIMRLEGWQDGVAFAQAQHEAERRRNL